MMKGGCMRLFIAINFSDEVKNALKKSIVELKKQAASGNFTEVENLHATLVFIGETNRVSVIKEAIDSAAPESFMLRVGGMGRFARSGGDIYWVGIERNPTLAELANKLSSALRSAGFNIDNREYKPHITIGREVMADRIVEFDAPTVSMTVNRISLMKSERINGRLTYTEIYGRQL